MVDTTVAPALTFALQNGIVRGQEGSLESVKFFLEERLTVRGRDGIIACGAVRAIEVN